MKRQPPQSVVPSPSVQLAELIRGSGQTYATLAAAAGISPSSLSRFTRGERSLALWTVDRLATALGGVRLEAARKPRRSALASTGTK